MENGRSLATATDGTTNISYAYDANGLRTSKTVGSTTTYYFYAGGQLLRQTTGGTPKDFFYDANGYPYAMKQDGETYYYITNLQGDVMQMVDAEGNVVASYEYDPYGKIISATGSMASANPLRYRGYYYDDELEMYYLQSRYYDPATGRFINADVYASTGQGVLGHNMFAYCNNNPVNHFDSDGNSPLQVAMLVIFGVVGFAFADWVARSLGLAPKGKGFWNASAYWALTSAIAIGGAAIGWYAGTAITEAAVGYLAANPQSIVRLANKYSSLFKIIMVCLGMNPFQYMPDAGKMTALARALNGITIPQQWAQTFCELANKFGRKLLFDTPHGKYGYHIHLCGTRGQKLEELHLTVAKKVWEILKRYFG